VIAGAQTSLKQWIIGLGADVNETSALQKAHAEYQMLKSSFSNPQDSLNQPKASCLKQHMVASAQNPASSNLETIFNGGGELIGSFKTTISKTDVSAEHCYASDRYIVRCTHNQLLPLSFGEFWNQSENHIFSLLRERGLNPSEFSLHPLF